jgi:hypothetical protein
MEGIEINRILNPIQFRMIALVTLTFTFIFIGILTVISAIDMFIWKEPFFSCLAKLFTLDKGTNEGFINVTATAGFIYSLVIDYRLRKNKRSKQL